VETIEIKKEIPVVQPKVKPKAVEIDSPAPVKEPERVKVKKEEKIENQNIQTDFATIQSKWSAVLAKVKSKSVPVEGLLRATRPIGLDGARVLIEATYQFHKEQLELARNSLVLEEILESVFGEPLRIRVSIGSGTKTILSSPHNNVSGKVDDEGLVQAAQDAFL